MRARARAAATFLAFFVFLCALSTLSAQERRFGRIDRSDGLVNSGVSSIVQDSQGFLWFGTKGGLARYDGYSFVTYQNDPFDTNSLSHNLVQTLYLDSRDVLWIGTYRGLNRFDIRTRRFSRYTHDAERLDSLSNDVVTAIGRDADGRLWVGTLDGLNLMDEAKGTFVRYAKDLDRPGALLDSTIRAILSAGDGTLWFGTYGGLARYEAASDSFTFFRHDGADANSLPSDAILDLSEDARGFIWVACWNGGLARFNPADNSVRTWSLPDNRLYTLETSVPNVVYAGSWGGGLYELDTLTGAVVAYRANPEDPFGLTHDVVYSLLVDESGLLWIGTNGGGLNTLDRDRDRFVLYKHNPKVPGSLAPGLVTAVLEDREGTLWVGTYNGGLCRLDRGAAAFVHYRHDPKDPESLSNNIVNGIIQDPEGAVWVATNEGLNRLDRNTGRFSRFYGGDRGEGPLAEMTVYSIAQDSAGRHWYGYFRKGVERYDPKTGERRRYSYEPSNPHSLSDNLVYFIHIDSKERVWVGTNGGLNRYEPETDSFIRYRHSIDDPAGLPSDTLRSMLEDSKGRLWVGTASGGLSLLDPATGRFSHVFKRDGLSDDTVTSILEDRRGRLWLGTTYGLNVYDPESGTARQLELMDGLQGLEFSQAAFKNAAGELYLGGSSGLNKIVDADLKNNTHIPPIRITSFKVFDKDVDLGVDPSYLEDIRLSHRENFISIEFAGLDYVNPAANRYMYRLEGFDKDWIQAGTRRFATYTNLRGGNYLFRVKASNNNDLWNETGLSLALTVSHPFWETPAAFILYAILVGGILVLVAKWSAQNQRLQSSRAELAERLRIEDEMMQAKESAERANGAKSLFLANLSHEIRTPMNAVLGYADMLAEALKDDERRQLAEVIKRSGKNLLALLNDALDLSRIEAGKDELCLSPVDLRQLSLDLIEMFQLRAQEKGIFLRAIIADDFPTHLFSDETKLRQILVNLIGNGVKFTARGGVVLRVDAFLETVSGVAALDAPVSGAPAAKVFEVGEAPGPRKACTLVLTVSDTGPGIAPEHRKRIFEAFYQEPHTGSLYGGTGLGLAIVERLAESLGGKVEVESILGEGSTFAFRLPRVPVIEAGRPMAIRWSVDVDTAPAFAATPGAPGAPGFAGEDGPPGYDAVLLSPSRLRAELGPAGFGRLLEAVDGELIPLRATLSPVLIVDEWKGFFDRTKAVFGALGSPLLEDWIFRCSAALEDLDGPRLRRLAAELDALRPQ